MSAVPDDLGRWADPLAGFCQPVPAHTLTPCGSPARTAAARTGLVSQWISGYPNGASAYVLVDEPVAQAAGIAAGKCPRVTKVSVNCGSCSAARCTGLLPASSDSRNAVPS